MHYTISALTTAGAPEDRLVQALLDRGIARHRVLLSPLPAEPSAHGSTTRESLLTVSSRDLAEAVTITDTLTAHGGRAIRSAEESSIRDAS